MSSLRNFLQIGLVAAMLGLGGCATIEHSPPVPEKFVNKAVLPGYSSDRYVHGFNDAEFIADYQVAMRTAQPGPNGISILSLSGGGPNGAFGAGMIVGWTEAGTRPEFQVVTGVSTGALASPFAFLGPHYDERLKQAYTTIHDADIFVPHLLRSAFRLMRVDSLADTKSFNHVLTGLIDQEMLDDIARQYARGRRLYICTHELVSGRAIYWNMTAIAASGRPDALQTFRKVLIASASVPIVFPPQYFEVEAEGDTYTEIHTDGGLSRQAFTHLNGARAGLMARADGESLPLTVYIIRNGKTRPPYHAMPPHLMNIALRTTEALVSAEGVGDLYRIYAQTIEEQAAFRLAMIPDDFSLAHHGMFEPAFMRRLFDFGRNTIKSEHPWKNRPPFLASSDGS